MVQKRRVPKAGSGTRNEVILSTLLDVQSSQGAMRGDIGFIRGKVSGICNDVDELQNRVRGLEARCVTPPPAKPTPEQTWWEGLARIKKIIIITTSLLIIGIGTITGLAATGG